MRLVTPGDVSHHGWALVLGKGQKPISGGHSPLQQPIVVFLDNLPGKSPFVVERQGDLGVRFRLGGPDTLEPSFLDRGCGGRQANRRRSGAGAAAAAGGEYDGSSRLIN